MKSILNNISNYDFEKLVKTSNSKLEVLKKLNLSGRGHSYDILNSRLEKDNIDISHFYTHKYSNRKIDLTDILVENSTYLNTSNLKKRLIKDNILKNVCSLCEQIPFHNGKILSLQLDHINGINNDNRIENLRLLCPNCHSQTETYGSRKTIKNICQCCGKNIHKNKHMLCQECFKNSPIYLDVVNKRKNQKQKFDISKDELEQLVKTNSLTSIGKMFNVSGNAIKKRCKKLGINLEKYYWQNNILSMPESPRENIATNDVQVG
jgi:hypothetical protein